jgi:hypothetical protein
MGVEEPNRSKIPEAPLAPVAQVGSHAATRSQLSGALVGSSNQEATGSLDPEAL